MLAILLLHAGEVVSNERLIDELWGEGAPASAANTLRLYVSKLPKALGDGVLLTRGGGFVRRAIAAKRTSIVSRRCWLPAARCREAIRVRSLASTGM